MLARITAALPALALAACVANHKEGKVAAAQPTASRGKLSLNDVSILFPAPTGGFNEVGYLHASDLPNPTAFAAGLNALPLEVPPQPFLPKKLLDELEQQLQADHDRRVAEGYAAAAFRLETAEAYTSDYHAISVRLEPCANRLQVGGSEAQCQRQLRVQWQGKGLAALDLNLQTTYAIDEDDLQDIVARLLKLQQAAGITYREYINDRLRPNPIIVSQGLSGAYYLGVLGILHSYARASHLTMVAGLANSAPGDQSGDFHWTMLATAIAGGRVSSLAIPAAAVDADGKPYFVQRMPGDAGANDRVGGLLPPLPAGAAPDALFPVNAKKAVTANIPHLEDPKRYDSATLDCASCHRGMIERAASEGAQIFLNTEAYASDHWNLGNITDLTQIPRTTLQMFSYAGSLSNPALPTPVISQRTINESAATADFINSHYIK